MGDASMGKSVFVCDQHMVLISQREDIRLVVVILHDMEDILVVDEEEISPFHEQVLAFSRSLCDDFLYTTDEKANIHFKTILKKKLD